MGRKSGVNYTQEILEYLKERGESWTYRDAIQMASSATSHTVNATLRNLVLDGKVVQIGERSKAEFRIVQHGLQDVKTTVKLTERDQYSVVEEELDQPSNQITERHQSISEEELDQLPKQSVDFDALRSKFRMWVKEQEQALGAERRPPLLSDMIHARKAADIAKHNQLVGEQRELVEQLSDEVPDSEPLAMFQVVGVLSNGGEFMGTVVKARSPGFSGTYLLKEM